MKSIFWYDNGTSYTTFNDFDFQPKFIGDVLAAMSSQQRTAAYAACKNNTECLYDFAITGRSGLPIQIK